MEGFPSLNHPCPEITIICSRLLTASQEAGWQMILRLRRCGWRSLRYKSCFYTSMCLFFGFVRVVVVPLLLLFFAQLLLNLAIRKKVQLPDFLGENLLTVSTKSLDRATNILNILLLLFLPQIMVVENGCISNIRSWRCTRKWLWTTCGWVQTYEEYMTAGF